MKAVGATSSPSAVGCSWSWQVEERRGKYLDSYDIVLESDETLDVVNGILRYILSET